MTNFELKAYSADRVVIGIRNATLNKKIFQINLKSKDGSIFVCIPYAALGIGRIGILQIPAGTTDSVEFGHAAPITSHSVKYTHHPDGRAHFSLDGKVFTSVRKTATPLSDVNGHLFTVMVQGLDRFKDMDPNEKETARRGIVSLPLKESQIGALKFVAHLYHSNLFAMNLLRPRMDSALMPVQLPDGRRLVAVVLATKLISKGQPYLLIVSVEEIDIITTQSDYFVSLMGGFDSPQHVDDLNRATSSLLMIYPEIGDISALLRSVGSIDYTGKI